MKITKAVAISQIEARNFKDVRLTLVKCGLNTRIQYRAFDDYTYRIEFFQSSKKGVVHCGLYDRIGDLECGISEDVSLFSDRTVKDLIDKLSLKWMCYKLECMIELGIIKKVSGELFEMEIDPVLLKMKELYLNNNKLKNTDRILQWDALSLTLPFEELLDIDYDLTQYK